MMAPNPSSVIAAAVFDTKPYDRQALQQASAGHGIEWRFRAFRRPQDSDDAGEDARACCVLLNRQLARPWLDAMARVCVPVVCLRPTRSHKVDGDAGRQLSQAVTRFA